MDSSDAENLAEEYSGYLKVDIGPQVKVVEESIDETLTRLEEFENVLEMMKFDPSVDITSMILERRNELVTICEKVRQLETFVSIVKENVDRVEVLVLNAEIDLKNTAEGRIRSILKPFFKKSEGTSTASPRHSFTPPEIFSTSQLMKNAGVANEAESSLNVV